jgi:hypothetical protein
MSRKGLHDSYRRVLGELPPTDLTPLLASLPPGQLTAMLDEAKGRCDETDKAAARSAHVRRKKAGPRQRRAGP